ncbi:hypothetical protein [Dickeya lacustris]|uniref:C-type lysozyme inhibitor domain-containing protein n=1 Tax=Dickeya lacustris TaxID=2259638 RepID=A0ABY8G7T3_9GAMM|nr:hypothetical protein [Dickeya lacustris]WFN56026.1 hypothetical protein O1Q98_01470 [Dickeya lacustris]
MKKIISIVLFIFPAITGAATIKNLICTASYQTIESDGSVSGRVIRKDIKLRDAGSSFSVIINDDVLKSPPLTLKKSEGKTALIGEKDGFYYLKLDGNYLIMEEKKGFVMSDCR